MKRAGLSVPLERTVKPFHTLCQQGLLKGNHAKPRPQELNSQPGLEAIQGATNNGNIIICSQTHLYSIV